MVVARGHTILYPIVRAWLQIRARWSASIPFNQDVSGITVGAFSSVGADASIPLHVADAASALVEAIA